jgi:hypothetical protein
MGINVGHALLTSNQLSLYKSGRMGITTACAPIPKRITMLLFAWLLPVILLAQDPWVVTADKIDPTNYYGETVANGMIGIVSSPIPFKVKDVVVNGAFDLYGRWKG